MKCGYRLLALLKYLYSNSSTYHFVHTTKLNVSHNLFTHQLKFNTYCTYPSSILSRTEVKDYINFLCTESATSKFEKSKSNIVNLISQLKRYEKEIDNLKTLTSEDSEMKELIEEEHKKYRIMIEGIKCDLLSYAEPDIESENKGVTFTIIPGLGGREAKLFASELYEMYRKYILYKGWNIDYSQTSHSEGDGINKGEICISGKSIYRWLKYEAGVHRVQRIPVTEKYGKVQTSTCIINVIPNAGETDIVINNSDLKIDKKKSSAPGGQNVQKNDTCVVITHLPTGITVETQSERYQTQNFRIGMIKLKNILYNIEESKRKSDIKDLKKLQADSVARSNKIRTYNFPNNRITDHRINHSVFNIKLYMEGSNLVDEMIQLLNKQYEETNLIENIVKIVKDQDVEKLLKKRRN